jgi:hypothetical protein
MVRTHRDDHDERHLPPDQPRRFTNQTTQAVGRERFFELFLRKPRTSI